MSGGVVSASGPGAINAGDAGAAVASESAKITATNPILPGCYPDPSICRVGEDYYLIASTFEYFPGLPIFHSTDLANWRQIGHVITREDQLDYEGIRSSGGLYAPTIRHDGEKFWVVCTLVSHEGRHRGGNFVVTAPNINGPWSNPVWLDVDGIDPSIFFDDDGKVWLHGTRLVTEPEWPQQTETWLREYDPGARALVGPEHVLWTGAVRGAVWSEAPHIYRVDGQYYLLTAEGGTDFNHAVSVARAEKVTGPYVGAPMNPIFTHRHLGREYPIVGAGHADLVEARDGSWWAVLLAMRPYGGYHYNLGRETFLVPVVWEEGWPTFAPGVGRIMDEVPVPFRGEGAAVGGEDVVRGNAATRGDTAPDRSPAGGLLTADDMRWTTLRGPIDFAEALDDGWRMAMRPTTLADASRPALLAVRQQHRDVQVRAEMSTALAPGEEVGVVVRQSEDNHVRCCVVRDPDGGGLEFLAVHRIKGQDRVLERVVVPTERAAAAESGPFQFEISARGQDYQVRAGYAELIAPFDGRSLDSTATGGFLGLWFGVYATSNGRETETSVDLTRFVYEARE